LKNYIGAETKPAVHVIKLVEERKLKEEKEIIFWKC
jgi:hypothetical protein